MFKPVIWRNHATAKLWHSSIFSLTFCGEGSCAGLLQRFCVDSLSSPWCSAYPRRCWGVQWVWIVWLSAVWKWTALSGELNKCYNWTQSTGLSSKWHQHKWGKSASLTVRSMLILHTPTGFNWVIHPPNWAKLCPNHTFVVSQSIYYCCYWRRFPAYRLLNLSRTNTYEWTSTDKFIFWVRSFVLCVAVIRAECEPFRSRTDSL